MPPQKKAPAAEGTGSAEGQATGAATSSEGQIEDEVRQAAAEYFDRLTESASRLSDQARHVYSLSHDYAKEHPSGLIAGAFGLGIILGLLLDRD